MLEFAGRIVAVFVHPSAGNPYAEAADPEHRALVFRSFYRGIRILMRQGLAV